MMISSKKYASIVKASGWYDLVVTIPFATPWTLAALFAVLTQLHADLGLKGEFPPLSLGTTLFANLLGSVVVVWSLARILRPLPLLGRLDAVARCLFACWQIVAMANGASLLIAGFTAMEIVWGVAQLLPFRSPSEILRTARQ